MPVKLFNWIATIYVYNYPHEAITPKAIGLPGIKHYPQ